MANTPAHRKRGTNKLAVAFRVTYEGVRRVGSRCPAEALSCLLLLVMGGNLLSSAWHETLTNDEVVHIPSGYHYLVAGDFRLNPEHPPLVKMWACLPLLVIRPRVYEPPDGSDQKFERYTVLASIEFWQKNQPRFQAISFWSRVPMVLLTLALGVLIFVSGREVFGARAAVLAVALFSLEPTMLAHGWIVQTDVAAAFGYLLFFFSLQAYYRAPTFSRACWFGVATGIALLTKFSLGILIPIFLCALAYMAVRASWFGISRRRSVLQACVASVIVILMLNAAYFFQHPALAPQETSWIAGAAPTPLAAERVILWIRLLSKVFPTYYLFGLYSVFVHNHFGHATSLLGQYSIFGWWYYFPIAFALKTSLPFLLLSLGAIGWALWATIVRREQKLIPLLAGLAIYLGVSMTSSINIGVRHIAPLFPFLFLLGGVCLDRLLKASRANVARLLVVVLLGWMLVDGVRAYPNYLSFTNSLTLGKPAWALLSDSNVEWGENIGELARYLHAHGETRLVGSLSGGWATLPLYGVALLDFAPP
ncbi:MAG TPA: glycosyltransferase family 39 protein, partial [Pyrinomonadaceae bacterium]|nr:glycosyltransferase family 39 protein [Pyrinomonadaceae bacterium]